MKLNSGTDIKIQIQVEGALILSYLEAHVHHFPSSSFTDLLVLVHRRVAVGLVLTERPTDAIFLRNHTLPSPPLFGCKLPYLLNLYPTTLLYEPGIPESSSIVIL